MISRRRFLATGAAVALAPIVSGPFVTALRAGTPATPDLSTWPAVRAQFELSRDLIHLSSFYFSSHPRPVQDAIESYRRALQAEPYVEVERRMFQDSADNLQFAIRDDMKGYLGAAREEIALTPNTTTGLALVYAGLPLATGDEVLTTDHDHYSHHESIRFATERAHATWRRIPLYDTPAQATTGSIVSRLHDAIRPETRVVGLTWVHSGTGVRLPVRDISAMLAQVNRGRDDRTRVRMVLDGVHALGAVDETVADLGCDFLCAGTHKWMLAPRGTGIVWARTSEWARLRPTVPTFASLEAWNAWMKRAAPVPPANGFDHTPGGFQAYEHQWAMSAAFRFHEKIGRARVAGRIRELNDRCKRSLAAIPGVRVVTPMDAGLSAGIVCFEVHGMDPGEVGTRLMARHIVAGPSPYLPSYVRFAPSLVNNEADVDTAVGVVREIARG